MQDLKLEARIAPLPPVVPGGVLVVPAGLLAAMAGRAPLAMAGSVDTQAAAARARAVVMAIERRLGFEPVDREFERLGYDVESRVSGTGKLRFIEVKGRVSGADSVTVTKNEILYSLNKPDDFILALVEFMPDGSDVTRYLRRPFQREPGFGSLGRQTGGKVRISFPKETPCTPLPRSPPRARPPSRRTCVPRCTSGRAT